MIFANVNIGTTANNGAGDPLRNAFQVINQNFANIAAAGNTPISGVVSVAGRTGNVILGAQDVAGVATTAQLNATYTTLNAAINSSSVASQSFVMADWHAWQPIGNVYTISDAINQLAYRLKNAGY